MKRTILQRPLTSILACATLFMVPHVAHAQSAPDAATTADNQEEEIIVRGKTGPEAVRDVSGGVSAFSGDQLEQLGAETMEDYVTRMPGVVFNQSTPGDSTVTIRGISSGQDPGQGTTGYFINDVPLSDPGFTIGTPDIDTFDVETVTVLRGPQGTLFGSGSLGGAVNYQAARPQLTDFDMRVQGTVDAVQDGGVGDAERVMLNVPVINGKFGVRAVYSNRDIAGYVDNIGTGRDDGNSTHIEGGRFQALWQPGENTTINYLYLEQTTANSDAYGETIGLPDRQRSTLVPDPSRYETIIHNLRLDQEFSFGTLTAMATHHRKENETVQDITGLGLDFAGGPTTVTQNAEAEGDTYEVRLASSPGGRIDYLIGAMHDETNQIVHQVVHEPGSAAVVDFLFGAGSGAVLAPNDDTITIALPFASEESALFGEVTYHFNDQWKATVGGRAFRQQISSASHSSGVIAVLLTGASPADFTGPPAEENGFNPKVSLTWTPNEDFMAYALVSKGFRIGGPNVAVSAPGQPVPPDFQSDSLINYELGFRSDFFDRHFLLDMTAFYIDWDNIQLNRITSQNINFGINAGAAKVLGLETSATWRITDGLTWRSAVTYTDATLAADIPAYPPPPATPTQDLTPEGSRLPGSSKWLVSNELSYSWSAGLFDPSIILSHRFVSEAPSTLGTGAVEGDYNIFDARLRLESDRFAITAFIDNLGDERGVTAATATERTFVRPRTFGITLDYRM